MKKLASICRNCYHSQKFEKLYCRLLQYETKPCSTCDDFLDDIVWHEKVKGFCLENQIDD